MNKELEDYLIKVGLNVKDVSENEKFIENFNETLNAKLDTEKDEGKLLTYPVPKLGPNGSCTLTDELEEKVYDLRKVFKYNHVEKNYFLGLVNRLNQIVKLFNLEIKADWIGIYKKLDTKNGHTLIKLAYQGRPSRAEFPLNAEFAKHSNNSTVGLNGKAVLINSVKQHLEEGKPYYECDAEVQSELCVPIFSKEDEIIGIIDVESFKENFFDENKIVKIALVCEFLSGVL